MTQFTQKELTKIYWMLSQLQSECDVPAKYKLERILAKVSQAWGEAK